MLKINEPILQAFMKYRIKSQVQTYDIRGRDEYKGVLELEQLLQDDKSKSLKINNITLTQSIHERQQEIIEKFKESAKFKKLFIN